ncbi:hypothetical protein [Planotetraspora sp. GP83]|uniref:CBM96 family carbohydrate-binding protein n=1 Tax=Planotetraspora sp. GP83 TaxID=3156264 RepID=UPI003516027F
MTNRAPNSSYGGSTLLYVADAFGEVARSFIDFDGPALTGETISSATLNLTHDYNSRKNRHHGKRCPRPAEADADPGSGLPERA